jgi:hypothetical protein
MKINTLLITTILCTSALFGCNTEMFTKEDITTQTTKTATSKTVTKNTSGVNARAAASGFVEHVNYARVALKMKDIDLAENHIDQASNMISLIKGTSVQERSITGVSSGRNRLSVRKRI